MMWLAIIQTAILFWHATYVQGGDYVPKRTCATIYSQQNFAGEHFDLQNFDLTVNLRREYRYTKEGWQHMVKSIKVADQCTMIACSDLYFQGKCQRLTSTSEADITKYIPNVLSGNCTCNRQCKCSEIAVPRNHEEKGVTGRAYVDSDCNTCNSEYILLYKNNDKIPADDRLSISAFAAPHGCKLTVCPTANCTGFLYEGQVPVFKWPYGLATAWRMSCEDTEHVSSLPGTENNPKMINLPLGLDALKNLKSSDPSLLNHPGLEIAIKSAAQKRSSRNVYIIFLGHFKPYSLGFPHCKAGPRNKLSECRIPVRMEHFGITVEVRVIAVGISFNTDEGDLQLMASLEQYMANHEELKDSIPNAVIVVHNIDDIQFGNEGSLFQRMLHTINTQRSHLLDENYANVLFLFYRLNELPPQERVKPEAKIAQIEEVAEVFKIPTPFMCCMRSKVKDSDRFVNGYTRMENGDYWPQNVELKLGNMCDKAGDALGFAALKAYFEDSTTTHYSITPIIYDTKLDVKKVKQYCVYSASHAGMKGRLQDEDAPPMKYVRLYHKKPHRGQGGEETLFGRVLKPGNNADIPSDGKEQVAICLGNADIQKYQDISTQHLQNQSATTVAPPAAPQKAKQSGRSFDSDPPATTASPSPPDTQLGKKRCVGNADELRRQIEEAKVKLATVRAERAAEAERIKERVCAKYKYDCSKIKKTW